MERTRMISQHKMDQQIAHLVYNYLSRYTSTRLAETFKNRTRLKTSQLKTASVLDLCRRHNEIITSPRRNKQVEKKNRKSKIEQKKDILVSKRKVYTSSSDSAHDNVPKVLTKSATVTKSSPTVKAIPRKSSNESSSDESLPMTDPAKSKEKMQIRMSKVISSSKPSHKQTKHSESSKQEEKKKSPFKTVMSQNTKLAKTSPDPKSSDDNSSDSDVSRNMMSRVLSKKANTSLGHNKNITQIPQGKSKGNSKSSSSDSSDSSEDELMPTLKKTSNDKRVLAKSANTSSGRVKNIIEVTLSEKKGNSKRSTSDSSDSSEDELMSTLNKTSKDKVDVTGSKLITPKLQTISGSSDSKQPKNESEKKQYSTFLDTYSKEDGQKSPLTTVVSQETKLAKALLNSKSSDDSSDSDVTRKIMSRVHTKPPGGAKKSPTSESGDSSDDSIPNKMNMNVSNVNVIESELVTSKIQTISSKRELSRKDSQKKSLSSNLYSSSKEEKKKPPLKTFDSQEIKPVKVSMEHKSSDDSSDSEVTRKMMSKVLSKPPESAKKSSTSDSSDFSDVSKPVLIKSPSAIVSTVNVTESELVVPKTQTNPADSSNSEEPSIESVKTQCSGKKSSETITTKQVSFGSDYKKTKNKKVKTASSSPAKKTEQKIIQEDSSDSSTDKESTVVIKKKRISSPSIVKVNTIKKVESSDDSDSEHSVKKTLNMVDFNKVAAITQRESSSDSSSEGSEHSPPFLLNKSNKNKDAIENKQKTPEKNRSLSQTISEKLRLNSIMSSPDSKVFKVPFNMEVVQNIITGNMKKHKPLSTIKSKQKTPTDNTKVNSASKASKSYKDIVLLQSQSEQSDGETESELLPKQKKALEQSTKSPEVTSRKQRNSSLLSGISPIGSPLLKQNDTSSKNKQNLTSISLASRIAFESDLEDLENTPKINPKPLLKSPIISKPTVEASKSNETINQTHRKNVDKTDSPKKISTPKEDLSKSPKKHSHKKEKLIKEDELLVHKTPDSHNKLQKPKESANSSTELLVLQNSPVISKPVRGSIINNDGKDKSPHKTSELHNSSPANHRSLTESPSFKLTFTKSDDSSEGDMIENSQVPMSQMTQIKTLVRARSVSLCDTQLPLAQRSPVANNDDAETDSDDNNIPDLLLSKNIVKSPISVKSPEKLTKVSDELQHSPVTDRKRKRVKSESKKKENNIDEVVNDVDGGRKESKSKKKSSTLKNDEVNGLKNENDPAQKSKSKSKKSTPRREIKADYRCVRCEFATTNRTRLIAHSRTHTGGKTKNFTEQAAEEEDGYKCILCDFQTLSTVSIRRHIVKHTNEEQFKCKIPKKKSKLTPDASIQCDLCPFSTTKNRYLKDHFNRVHADTKYDCNVCGKKFTQLGLFNKHRSTHEAKACEYCGEEFEVGSIKAHMKVHTKDEIKCNICEKEFTEKHYLKAHMKLHTKDSKEKKETKSPRKKQYECDHCEQVLPTKKEYEKHIKQTHKEDLECNICKKKFIHKSKLAAHVETHTQGFKCELCDYVGKFKYYVTKHMRVHTKSLVCEYCDRSFGQQSHLNTHLSHHTSSDYKCKRCKKMFVTKKELKAHSAEHKSKRESNDIETVLYVDDGCKSANVSAKSDDGPKSPESKRKIEKVRKVMNMEDFVLTSKKKRKSKEAEDMMEKKKKKHRDS